jgi:Tetratricopeptide repeat
MARLPIIGVLLLALLLPAVPSVAETEEPADPQTLFFAGMDLKEAGDYEGAVSRFQLAIQLDPALHQARLHLAECYYLLGMKQPAIDELTLYLASDVAAKRTDQAHELLTACGANPVKIEKQIAAEKAAQAAADGTDGDTGYVPSTGGTGDTGTGTTTGTPASCPLHWTPVTVEVGPLVEHYGNDVQLTAVGPVVAGRFLVWRYLELLAQFHVGFGPYTGEEGVIRVPAWAFGAAASIPAGPLRIIAGVELPLAISRKGDETAGVNTGVLGVIGARGGIPDTRLVLGGQVEAGYLVRPTVAGSFRVGIQIGPMPKGP